MMSKIRLLPVCVVLFALLAATPYNAFASAFDIRGLWVGSAKGTIFGAEGSVTITQQNGEDIIEIGRAS